MAIAQQVAGLLARPGRHPAPRDGQEEEVRARQAVRGLLGRHEGQRLLGCRGQDALGHPAAVLRLRLQQGALGRPTACSATGPRTSRRTTRPSTWRRCSRASATRATSSRSTSTSAAAWASRCCRPTSTSRSATSRAGRRRHPLRPRRRAQRRLQRRRRDPRRARGEGPLHVVPRLPARRSPIQVANKRTVESLIKAGRVRLARRTRVARSSRSTRAPSSRAVKEKRAEEVGDVGFDFDSLFEDHEREAAPSLVPDRPEWAKRDKLAFEREMLGLYVSDHPLAGLEVPLAKHASTTITELIVVGCHAGRRHRHGRRPRHERAAPRRPPERQPVRHDPGRGLLGRDHGDVHGQGVPGVRARPAGRLDRRSCAGRVSMRDDGMNLHAVQRVLARARPGRRVGPGRHLAARRAGRRPTRSRALGDVLIRHRGDTEVRLRLVRGRTARVFELPYPVQVTADLYGELKSLLGPNCLV